MPVDVTIGEPVITERVPEETPGMLAGFWSTAEDYYHKSMVWYSHTAVSNSADKVLAKVEPIAQKINEASNAWLGFAANPENITAVLKMAMVIVIVLGVVYVVSVSAPLISAIAK